MGFIIRSNGLLTTIQDLGRYGFQEYGIPVSGAMDRDAAILANKLVGNDVGEAVIEMTMMGSSLEFTEDNAIAITGADLSPSINGFSVQRYSTINVYPGDLLTFGAPNDGNFCYVAFSGGLDIPIAMGSRSTYMKAQLGGYCGRKLSEGDMIGFCNPKPNVSKARFSIPKFKSDVTILRVILGPQDDLFTQTGIDTFLSGEFSMTFKFDRMGCQLDGPFIEHTGSANIISDAIAFGAIQMPEHGHPIIMLADRQTVGGYPKIANVISVDLPKLVQCKLGSKIRFKAIEIADAQNLLINSNVGNY